ncbi:PorT family protein [bacterium]|nr:PorT family protein [bacterium]
MNKRIHALGAAVFLLAASASGETGVKVGLQAGVALTNLNPPSGVSASNIAGFTGGIAVDVPMNENLSLRPEALFTQRGSTIVEGGSGNVTARVNALDVPIFLRINFGEGIRANIFGGPNFTFNLSNSLVAEAGGNAGAVTFDPKTVDFGVAFGAGVDLGPVFVNLRYMLGLLNVSNTGASWESRGFLLLAGIHL